MVTRAALSNYVTRGPLVTLFDTDTVDDEDFSYTGTGEHSTSTEKVLAGSRSIRAKNTTPNAGTTYFIVYNLPVALQVPPRPILCMPVWIADYTLHNTLRIRLDMGTPGSGNAFSVTYQIGPSGHEDKRRNGWHWLKFSGADWAVFSGSPAWTSPVARVTIDLLNQGAGTNPEIYFESLHIASRNRPKIVLMADDVPSSLYTLGKPILDAYGIKASLAVSKNLTEGYMTSAQYMEMLSEGHELTVHSENQIGVQLTSVAQVLADVRANQAHVRDVLGSVDGSRFFIYPNGRYWLSARGETQVAEMLQAQLGILAARTTDTTNQTISVPQGWRNGPAGLESLMYMGMLGPLGADGVSALFTKIDKCIERGDMGMLVFHGLNAEGGAFPDESDFEDVVARLALRQQQGEVDVVTLSQWYAGLSGGRSER